MPLCGASRSARKTSPLRLPRSSVDRGTAAFGAVRTIGPRKTGFKIVRETIVRYGKKVYSKFGKIR